MNAFKQARLNAGHTQADAARLVYCTERAIRRTEAADEPSPARLELYLIKTGQMEAVDYNDAVRRLAEEVAR